MPTGEEVKSHVNGVVVVLVQGVKEMLFGTKPFLGKVGKLRHPGRSWLRRPAEHTRIESFKAGVGALQFLRDHE